jgi:hypothetical protein
MRGSRNDKRLAPVLPARVLVACAWVIAGIPEASLAEPLQQKTAPPAGVSVLADRILGQQLADGAIVQGQLPAASSRVVPYFADMAAHGLADAYRVTRDRRYLEGARRWIAWYEAHQNANGTIYDYDGSPGSWKATGDYDSTDSYASTYLEAVWALHRARPDDAWLRDRLRAARKCVEAIRLTLQPNGMTLVKPTYPVMYTMDNTETAVGLRCAARIERAVGDAERSRRCDAEAATMERAVASLLWDDAAQCYLIGLQPDGYRHRGLSKWYPDVMANLMAIGWLPRSERNVLLLKRLRVQFGQYLPTAVGGDADLGRLVWWGVAAMGAGDRALLDEVRRALSGIGQGVVLAEPSTLGLACRILSEE